MTTRSLQSGGEELAVLRAIVAAGVAADDETGFLGAALDATLQVLDYDVGAVYLIDESGEQAALSVHRDLPGARVETQTEVLLADPALAGLFTSAAPVFAAECTEGGVFSDLGGLLKAVVAVPLPGAAGVLGALSLASTRRTAIDESERVTLAAVGSAVGTVLDRMRARERVTLDDAILAAHPDPVVLLDENGAVTQVNTAACALADLGEQDLVGLHIWDLGTVTTAEAWAQSLEVLRQLGSLRTLCEVNGVGDQTRMIDALLTRFVAGAEARIACFLRDVTVQWHADEALRRSEERYRELVELLPDAVAIVGLDGTVQWVSSRARELFGLGDEDVTGKPALEWLAPEERDRGRAALADIAEGRPVAAGEFVMLRDGARFWADMRIARLLGEDGAVGSLLAVIRDVDERRRAAAEHHVLAGMARLSLSSASSEDIAGVLPSLVAGAFGFEICVICLADGKSGELVVAGSTGLPEAGPARRDLAAALAEQVARSGRAVAVPDAGGADGRAGRSLREAGIATALCVPLHSRGEILGTLSLAARERRLEPEGLLDSLQVVGDAFALEVERRRAALALARSEARHRDLLDHFHGIAYRRGLAPNGTTLLEGSVAAITGYEADDFRERRVEWCDLVHPDDMPRVKQIEELLAVVPGYRTDEVYRIVRRDGQLRWVQEVVTRLEDERGVIQGAIYDVTDHVASQSRLEASEEKLRRVFNSTHDAIIVHDCDGRVVEANETFLHLYGVGPADARRYGVAELSDPEEPGLARVTEVWREVAGGRPQLLAWQARRPGDGYVFPVEAYLCPLEVEGEQLVLANIRDMSDRRRAEREALDAAARLRRTVEGTVAAMGAMVETRDPYTAGHMRRVTELAVAIARELGLDAERVDTLRVAGEVHDIGKVAVPAELLTKPGLLSATEFAIIKVHPVAGADILAPVEFGAPVAAIVRSHHERLDGSGYPDGLAGDQISLEARIVAVADVVEAMASHRPYRAALGIEAALAEIKGGAGRLYDPEAAEACRRVFAAGFSFRRDR